MTVRLALAIAAALAGTALATTPAAAAPPQSATLIATGPIPLQSPSAVFTATAVACANGTTDDPSATATTIGSTVVFRTRKVFTCADGSGTFTIGLAAVRVGCSLHDYGLWRVVGGTGDYATLRGAGALVGTYSHAGDPCEPNAITDRFYGVLQLP